MIFYDSEYIQVHNRFTRFLINAYSVIIYAKPISYDGSDFGHSSNIQSDLTVLYMGGNGMYLSVISYVI